MIIFLATALCCPAQALSDPSLSLPEWRRPGRCAANCLYVYLMMLYGMHERDQRIPYEELVRALPIGGAKGSSMADLGEAARLLGEHVEVRKVGLEHLPRLPTPFIAHLDYLDRGGTGHFITVFKIEHEGTVRYIDGTSGLEHAVALQNLKPLFTGYVLHRPPAIWRSFAAVILAGLILGLLLGALLTRSQARTQT
jgi:ABC-type bacteriocin/lantibiotic exporter with double-glycine peptidase domain